MPVSKIDQELAMGALVLACGNTVRDGALPALAPHCEVSRDAGGGVRDHLDVLPLPANPGRSDIDPRLAELGGRRLVVVGRDADLAAVVRRLLRTDRLADVIVGFVPVPSGESEVAAIWRLPRDPGRALELAVTGEVEPIPMVRDDSGGVLLGLGSMGPVRGVAYCDDETALRGRASRIEVTPDPQRGAGLIVRVIRTGLLGRRASDLRGRAFQLGCLPVHPVTDGVARPRAVTRWTWYRHTEDLRAVRGVG